MVSRLVFEVLLRAVRQDPACGSDRILQTRLEAFHLDSSVLLGLRSGPRVLDQMFSIIASYFSVRLRLSSCWTSVSDKHRRRQPQIEPEQIPQVGPSPSTCFQSQGSDRNQDVGHQRRKVIKNEHTHVLVVVVSPLGPAEAVEGHIGGSVLPADPERALGHLRELQVFGGRNHL